MATKPDDPDTQTPAIIRAALTRSFCASNSTSLMQWAKWAVMLLSYHVAMKSVYAWCLATGKSCSVCVRACACKCVQVRVRVCMRARVKLQKLCKSCMLKNPQQLLKIIYGQGTADSPHHPTSECWEADPCHRRLQNLVQEQQQKQPQQQQTAINNFPKHLGNILEHPKGIRRVMKGVSENRAYRIPLELPLIIGNMRMKQWV